MAKRKVSSNSLNQEFDFQNAIHVKGKTPTRSELKTLFKEKKEAKFTTRLTETDFLKLKQIASKKGIGYQTLLGQIIHDYVTGQLADVEELRKIFPNMKFKAG
jgi:predicted DNA binding CopG/RHH family protein